MAIIEPGQNVSTLQKFTAECSLTTLNGKNHNDIFVVKSKCYNGLFTKEQHDSLNKTQTVFYKKVLFFSLLHRRIRYERELVFKCQCRLQMNRENEEEGVHNTAR